MLAVRFSLMQRSGSVEVRPASAAEVVDLRHEVLRQGLPREAAVFPGDEDPTTRHFVAAVDGRIVGCVTLLLNESQGEPAWQLRGMAVAAALQRTRVGSRMLEAVDAFVAESATPLLWCNARVPAIPFYERNGWNVISEPFDVPTAGPHVVMTRRLKSGEATVR